MIPNKRFYAFVAPLLVISCVFISLTNIAFAGTYWVSPTGAATWANCQSASPLSGAAACAYTTANTNAAAADTVYYRGGTYNLSGEVTAIAPSNSGTAGSRITFSSYTGETVNFVGNHIYSKAIDVEARNYIRITGLVGSGPSGYGMTFRSFGTMINGNYSGSTPSHYNEIDHCEFGSYYGYPASAATCGSINFRGSSFMRGSTYNWIHNNYFHDWQCYTIDYDGPVIFELGIEEGNTSDSYNLIENNIFAHSGHHVVGLQAPYNIFRNNIVHNGPYYDVSDDGQSRLYGYRNLYTNGGTIGENIIEGNRIGPSGISYLSWSGGQRGGTSFYLNSSTNLVRNNYIFGALGMAMNIRYYSYSSSYNHIYNQTFYYTGYSTEDDIQCEERWAVNNDYNSTYNKNNVIKNTLFNKTWAQTSLNPQQSGTDCERSSAHVIWGTSTTMTYANNLASSATDTALFINPSMADSSYVNLPDLRLKAGTAPINAGGALTTVAAADTGSGTSLIVTDARYFSDGKFGRGISWPSWITTVYADRIAVGTVSNVVQISSINYSTNTITLANSISRSVGNNVWLYSKSDGEVVLYGSAPDIGAYEYPLTDQLKVPNSPNILTITP